jgi:NADPH-dependent curcumin reductase CurA
VINYRETPDFAPAVREACPDGVDLFFDNVGGSTLDALLLCTSTFGRIVNCGMIAAYHQGDQPPPVHHLWEVVARQLRMQGFLLLETSQDAVDDPHDWVASGEPAVLENLTRGIDNCRRSLLPPHGGQHGRQDVDRVGTAEGRVAGSRR